MNIDYGVNVVFPMTELGYTEQIMLPSNSYLEQLRSVLERHNISRVWAQGPFYGKRVSGINFFIQDPIFKDRLCADLCEVVETYEYTTGGDSKRCGFFIRSSATAPQFQHEVIYEDGIFYSNGITHSVPEHNVVAELPVDQMRLTVLGLLDALDKPQLAYKLVKLYRCSVFLFSLCNCIDYACPEYVDAKYSYMKEFRKLAVVLENRHGDLNECAVGLLSERVLQYLREDVMKL